MVHPWAFVVTVVGIDVGPSFPDEESLAAVSEAEALSDPVRVALAVTVTVLDEPEAMEPRRQFTTPELSTAGAVQLVPVGFVSDLKVSPDGSVRLAVTLVAVAGPALDTVIV
jgi:hypothetical protein